MEGIIICGLVGVVSTPLVGIQEKNIFTNLLQIDVIRGFDSTGIFCSNFEDNNVNVIKKNVDSITFTQSKLYKNAISFTKGVSILAGHNRWATVGDINIDNSHPFSHGSITMMHNGTLLDYYNLDRNKDFETDSECIAYNLSSVSPKKAGEIISKLNGAFALVWFDKRDKSLNFIRNKERPLWMSYGTDINGKRTCLAWASEAFMLSLSFERNFNCLNVDNFYETPFETDCMKHYKITYNKKKGELITSTYIYNEYISPVYNFKNSPNQYHYNDDFCLPKKGTEITFTPVGYTKYKNSFTTEEETGYIHGVYGVYKKKDDKNITDFLEVKMHGVSSSIFDKYKKNFMRGKVLSISLDKKIIYLTYLSNSSKTSIFDDNDENDDIFNDELLYLPGPNGSLLSKKEFEKAVEFGCSHCSKDLSIDDADQIEWYGDNYPICMDCASEHYCDQDKKKA